MLFIWKNLFIAFLYFRKGTEIILFPHLPPFPNPQEYVEYREKKNHKRKRNDSTKKKKGEEESKTVVQQDDSVNLVGSFCGNLLS